VAQAACQTKYFHTDDARLRGETVDGEYSSVCTICSCDCRCSGRELGVYRLYYCQKCNFYFSPEAFDSTPDYDEAYSSPAYMKNQVDPIRHVKDRSCFGRIPTYRAFFDNISPSSTRALLDLGCGVGRFCHAAHAAGWDVTGIDVSHSAISIAKQYAPFRLVCGSMEDAIKEHSTYDVVTAFEVLEHIAAPLDFVKQVRLLLSEPGRIFFTVPNWDCRLVQTATAYDAIPPFHINFFTQDACQALLEAAGYRSIRTGTINVDRMPRNLRSLPKWMMRRLLGRPQNLGLWACGLLG